MSRMLGFAAGTDVSCLNRDGTTVDDVLLQRGQGLLSLSERALCCARRRIRGLEILPVLGTG